MTYESLRALASRVKNEEIKKEILELAETVKDIYSAARECDIDKVLLFEQKYGRLYGNILKKVAEAGEDDLAHSLAMLNRISRVELAEILSSKCKCELKPVKLVVVGPEELRE